MIELIIPTAIALFLYATTLFIVSLIIKRNDIADIAWGPGIALVAIMSLWLTPEPTATHLVVSGLIVLWATRLGLRIWQKNRRKGEDPRYARWRASWGKIFYIRSYLQVYLLQASLMLAVGSVSLYIASLGLVALNPYTLAIGLMVWLVGFYFEVVGDARLDRFLRDPANKGQLMTSGLWQYTRHPNYFGEVTMWWGLWIIGLNSSLWWLALISPVTITILILFVSGIPLLEKGMRKHPDWAAYAARTSVFIPWWPRA